MIDRSIRFFLEHKVIVFLFVLMIIGGGIIMAPFDWDLPFLPRNPIPVDAIPDVSENQQIVFTEWPGRSPQDVEDQVTYPLTVSLLGIPNVKTIRSQSGFGFSSIYIIFKDNAEFYWARSRILEKLNSLSSGMLPDNVQPVLGPDATPLGQVFWYTLEGRDPDGNPAGGWNLDELRSIQDWYVRYGLLAAEGVSEVASVGGFVREYQIDVDPDSMRINGVTLEQVFNAVRMANREVGARNIEINRVEYIIRGLGFVRQISDIESAVVTVNNNVPIYVKTVAHVSLGPAYRRGALDKEGSEAVGGVVTVRFGGNPLSTIKHVKKKIEEISPGLPKKTLADGTISKVTIVPFYDRSGLIYETLGTLNTALVQEILVTIIVILVMVVNLRGSLLISSLLPLAVLFTFIMMKIFRIDANIVALAGIAIAIGTMVDMGIVLCENIINRFDAEGGTRPSIDIVYDAAREVGGAVFTAVATTVVSFLPVFTMHGAEGKMFKPLAYTKTFALIASLFVALAVLPALAHIIFKRRSGKMFLPVFGNLCLIIAGLVAMWFVHWLFGFAVVLMGALHLARKWLPDILKKSLSIVTVVLVVLLVTLLLTLDWLPLGPEKGSLRNLLFVGSLLGFLLLGFYLFYRFYRGILNWCLNHKPLFLLLPVCIFLLGGMSWLGFNRLFGWLPLNVKILRPVAALAHVFPGLGREFMPPLDEGSYLFMPTTSPHASIGEVLDVISKQDMRIQQIHEVDSAVGKLGRAETALDPAPLSMIETIINYKPEFLIDKDGRRLRFSYDPTITNYFLDEAGSSVLAPDGEPYMVKGQYERDENGALVPNPAGKPFRLWRPPLDPALNPGRSAWPGISKPDDIWDRIVAVSEIPGTTSAPRLQPIAARIVMLQSGMRAPMGVKIKGPNLEVIEQVGFEIQKYLKEVASIEPVTVNADQIIGKPYLEIIPDRNAIARYGINVGDVQEVIEVAVGGKKVTTTVEGRERYPVRVRYKRELRDSIESLKNILVSAAGGAQIPLAQLAEITYVRGPQMIKSEDTFLVGYVLFDKKPGFAEVDVVEQARDYLAFKRSSGEWELPAGVSYTFAGNYENQVRAQKTLVVILPLALLIIFIILYMHFKSTSTSLLVFSGIAVAWAGGFILLWLYGQSWFLDFSLLGVNMRTLFQVHPINLSVAVWVGFLALFGIASDDGVVMATYLDEQFKVPGKKSVAEIRECVLQGGLRRVRPCLMTTATTILALIPVITSTGRGSDLMMPMAVPIFGGMIIEVITMLIVPTLYCALKELNAQTMIEPYERVTT